ncbi:MAG: hypothetical protein FJ216_07915 [Ignavibacteria bacterium]|nr:hypothetical protein [Ignavibacteria bacterium]
MKKYNLIFGIAFTVLIIFLLITNSPLKISSETNKTGNTVKFIISGCDDPQCTGLACCIDSGPVFYPPDKNCTFTVEDCSKGTHNIYAECGNKSGVQSYYCSGTGGIIDVYVTVTNPGPSNPCSDKK